MTKRFGGFLISTDPVVGVPQAFFTDVLPQLTDISEIQVTLAVFRLAATSGGFEAPLQAEAILRDAALRAALRVVGSPREPDNRIQTGLDLALGRGTLLRFAAEQRGKRTVWYYVNTPVNQALIAAMSRGAIAPPPVVWDEGEIPHIVPDRPNVFRLYEQNVGLLTPLIADRLVDALETYPAAWIEEAIAEAVSYNRRSWRYIQRILEQWASAGRDPGAGRNQSDEAHSRRDPNHLDPDLYKQGRYLNRGRRP